MDLCEALGDAPRLHAHMQVRGGLWAGSQLQELLPQRNLISCTMSTASLPLMASHAPQCCKYASTLGTASALLSHLTLEHLLFKQLEDRLNHHVQRSLEASGPLAGCAQYVFGRLRQEDRTNELLSLPDCFNAALTAWLIGQVGPAGLSTPCMRHLSSCFETPEFLL